VTDKPRGWKLVKEVVLIIGVFALVASMIVALVAIRAHYHRKNESQPPTIDDGGRVFYFRDHDGDSCFAIARVHTSKGWLYLMTWVPCTPRLPLATPSAEETFI
jgi:hypothetical protein